MKKTHIDLSDSSRKIARHLEVEGQPTSTITEELLATDDLFVDCFNAFLTLPSFPEPVLYNKKTCGFEVCSEDTKQKLSKEIRCVSRRIRYSINNNGHRTASKTRSQQLSVATNFTVMTLDKEQGIQWVKEHRLPTFVDSDCYLEYRLAKLLSQVSVNGMPAELVSVHLDLTDTLAEIRFSNRKLQTQIKPPDVDNTQALLQSLYVSLGSATFGDVKDFIAQAKIKCPVNTTYSTNQTRPSVSSAKRTISSSLRETDMPISDNSIGRQDGYAENVDELGSKHEQQEKEMNESDSRTETFEKTEHDAKFIPISSSTARDLTETSINDFHSVSRPSSSRTVDDTESVVSSSVDGSCLEFGTCNLSRLKGIREFQRFLCDTPGEKIWNFWMDIERAKLMTNQEELERHLSEMRTCYIICGGQMKLAEESKIWVSLSDPSSWCFKNLVNIESEVLEPLIYYWAPRYLLQQNNFSLEKNELYKEHLKTRPLRETEPNPPLVTRLPHRPKSCIARVSHRSDTSSTIAGDKLVKESINNSKTMDLAPRRCKSAYTRPASYSNQIQSRPHTVPTDGASRTPNNRAQSASSKEPKSLEKVDFYKSDQVDRLLRALANECSAGRFFRKFIEKSGKELWKHCLTFWECCQEYHKLFYAKTIEDDLLAKKTKYMYSIYIGPSAPCNLNCARCIADEIYRNLHPPREELFDPVEEHVIEVLYDAWNEAIKTDLSAYEKVRKIEVKRSINSRHVKFLQKHGVLDNPTLSNVETRQNSLTNSTSSMSTQEAQKSKSEGFTLQRLFHNRVELEHFRKFLADNFASLDLHCWMDIENYKKIPEYYDDMRQTKANDIVSIYLNRKYFFGPNSPAGLEGQAKVIATGGGFGRISDIRPSDESLFEVQKYVQQRLEFKWLPLFLSSEEFLKRQHPSGTLGDVAEDAMAQHKRKTQAVARLLDSKWSPSLEKVTQLRKALLNPLTNHQFIQYVSVKGDCTENNILFWLEVQKYKEVCHSLADQTLIQQKAEAIVQCFIESNIPPSIQISIDEEMAEKIIEKKLEGTANLFHDAERKVFVELLPYWEDFCRYRDRLNVTEDQLQPILNKRKEKARALEKRKLKNADEKLQKENARKMAALSSEFYKPNPSWFGENFETDHGLFRLKPFSWSYSKYLAALEKEQVLCQLDVRKMCIMLQTVEQQKNTERTVDEDATTICDDDTVSEFPRRRHDSEISDTMSLDTLATGYSGRWKLSSRAKSRKTVQLNMSPTFS